MKIQEKPSTKDEICRVTDYVTKCLIPGKRGLGIFWSWSTFNTVSHCSSTQNVRKNGIRVLVTVYLNHS